MLSAIAQQKILDKVLSDPEFSASKTSKKLLRFLVESSIHNVPIKEYDIAIKVFDKGPDFDPVADSTVRVYVSNLRKILKEYYSSHAGETAFQIRVPTGRYQVEFIKSSRTRFIKKNNWPRVLHAVSYSLLIIVILLLVTLQKNKNSQIHNPVAQSLIWNDIINTDNPVLLTLGDDLFFIEETESSEYDGLIVRNHNINTLNEFKFYKQYGRHSRKITSVTTYPFVPYHSILALPSVSRLLDNDSEYSLACSSQLKADDILQNNIIFLGSFRNLFALERAVKSEKIDYVVKYFDSHLRISTPDSVLEFRVNGAPDQNHVDYCLVRKIPGPQQNTIIMFITFSQAAMASATDYILSPEKIKIVNNLFMKEFGEIPQYFNLIFKTTGYDRTAFKTSIVYYEKLNADDLTIW